MAKRKGDPAQRERLKARNDEVEQLYKQLHQQKFVSKLPRNAAPKDIVQEKEQWVLDEIVKRKHIAPSTVNKIITGHYDRLWSKEKDEKDTNQPGLFDEL